MLKAAGSDKTRILKANIWLTDISTFDQMNKAWDAWVVPGQTPARATVESKLAAPGYDVEIMIEAAFHPRAEARRERPSARSRDPARRRHCRAGIVAGLPSRMRPHLLA